MKFFYLIFIFFMMNIYGCQSLSGESNAVENSHKNGGNEQQLEKVITALADQLLLLDKFDYKNQAMVLTTLVWADTLQMQTTKYPHHLIGHHISDSLKVEFVQRGCKVIEHQSSDAISMTKTASYYLSRDLKELPEQVDIQYVLAGTLLEMEKGLMAHIEIIDIYSKEIVGSAKKFIPNSYLVTNNQVVFKNDRLQRDSAR